MNPEKTVAQALAEALVRHGVEVMFSQSLPSALLLAAEKLGIRQLAYRTENAGAAMADGFARVSGKLAIVTAQNGPAATLLVPGLAEAMKASIPVVALVQEVNVVHADKNAFQEYDHESLFQSCTKWTRKLNDPERALDYLDLAITTATTGRPGPVALLLPADVLNIPMSGRDGRRRARYGTFPLDRPQADPACIAEAAELLADAKRPLVIAGGGVHVSGACQELMALQRTGHLPVATTVMGKGAVDEQEELSVGVGGYAMGRLAPMRHMRFLFDEADVVFLIGTRTNQNATDSWTLYPRDARYIHLDIDGQEIGRNYEALRLVGDIRQTLAALNQKLTGRRREDASLLERLRKARKAHQQDMAHLLEPANAPARPEQLMVEMQKLLRSDSIVVADASYSSLWIALYLKSQRAGQRFITPRGLAGLGWGMPLALGAKVASPKSEVFCVVGDGGFAHVWSELETAKRSGVKLIVTVLNNGILGYQKHAENAKFGSHTTACYFAPVDHAAIARACGCNGISVRDGTEYLPALREALAFEGTSVIDVATDPAAFPPVTLFDSLESGA